MILQKEVKYTLGLGVILLLIAAALFMQNDEEANTTELTSNTPVDTSATDDVVPLVNEEPTNQDTIDPFEDTPIMDDNEDTIVSEEDDSGTSVTSILDDNDIETASTHDVSNNGSVDSVDNIPIIEENDSTDNAVTSEEPPVTHSNTPSSPLPTLAGGGTRYVVQRGDNYGVIAKKFYNSAVLWRVIADANRDILETELMPGQEIFIPKHDVVPVKQKSEAIHKPVSAVSGDTMVYTVQKGDILEKISLKFYGVRTKWNDILKANPKLRDEYSLRPGMQIVIPGVAKKQVAPLDTSKRVVAQIPDIPDFDSAKTKTGKGIVRKHIIKEDDTLWKLAELYYGNGMRYKDILKANPSIHSGALKVGQVIVIPGLTGGSSSRGANYFMYTVKEGDYLSTIASDLLGKASRWREIVAINPGLDPNRLKTGMRIKIPGISSTDGNAISVTPAAPRQVDLLTGGVYIVKSGDTLQKISQKFYNTTTKWKLILQANPHIRDENTLYVGAKLTIPQIVGREASSVNSRQKSSFVGNEPPVRNQGNDTYLKPSRKKRNSLTLDEISF